MTTYSCDCCQRTGLHDDEIAEHTQDRDTPWGYMAVPTQCVYCAEGN
jgi:hypothetical protein